MGKKEHELADTDVKMKKKMKEKENSFPYNGKKEEAMARGEHHAIVG